MTDSCCVNCPEETINIKIATTGDLGVSDNIVKHAENYNVPGVNVEVVTAGNLFEFQASLEAAAKEGTSLADGFLFPSILTGALVQAGALWDLTDFTRESAQLAWDDVLPFYRERIAVYDNIVRVLPADGDLLSLYYRKDLFDKYNRTVPRTWEEYTTEAEFFTGLDESPDSNSTFYGSCVGRGSFCANGYWATMMLSSMTQSQGVQTGAHFDPETMSPKAGKAFAQVLKYMEDQAKYENPEAMGQCILYQAYEMQAGHCAMAYNWGNQIPGSQVDGTATKNNLGVAPTPGSTKVLNTETGELETCTPANCPYGVDVEGVGRVNYAPYAAFGGWASGVSNFSDDKKKRAAADFLAFMSNPSQSIDDVIPPSELLINVFANPFRKSHLDVDTWKSRGYSEETTREQLETYKGTDSANAVLELRIPNAFSIIGQYDAAVEGYLTGNDKSETKRLEYARDVTIGINKVVADHDAIEGNIPMKDYYQQSLGVYIAPNDEKNLIGSNLRTAGLGLSGIVFFLSLIFILWTIVNRGNRVVRASQPGILFMVATGAIIMASTVITISVDDSWASLEKCDLACMLSPWLYSIGFVTLFSALFSKTLRIKQIYDDPEKHRRLKVSIFDVAKTFGVLFTINALILLVWTLQAPLKWKRIEIGDQDDYGLIMPPTYGVCLSDESSYLSFAGLLVTVNFLAIVYSNVLSFKCRQVVLEFHESQWITMSMTSIMQLWMIGLPIMILVSDEPKALFFVRTAVVVLSCLTVLLLIFLPKAKYMLDLKKKGDNDMTINSGGGDNESSSRRRSTISGVGGIQIISHPKTTGNESAMLKKQLEAVQKEHEELLVKHKELTGIETE